jgi:DNA helicase II / ATP-dependent DNA helicase PcrA
LNLDKLDKNQRMAVLTESKFTLVCAAPGAGKTTVLIYRTEYLINAKAVPCREIAVITFTKAAALNMKKRFELFLNAGSKPFIGTFHSLFYHILSEKKKINLIDEYSAKTVINNVLKNYTNRFSEDQVKEVLNSIMEYKNYRYGMYNVKEFKPCIDNSIFMECYNYYEGYKQMNCLMDFEDLQIETLKLIESEGINNTFCSGFKYMLIDEFQDSDSLEIEFLKRIGSISSIYAVGDEDQSVYSFRNARPDCMVNFEEHFPLGKKIFLNTNYRCPSNITLLSQEIIKFNMNRNHKTLCADRKDNGGIYICHLSDEIQSAKKVAEIIEKGVSSRNYNYKDYAVLFRTRFESTALIDSLVSRNIPLNLFDDIYNIYNHFIFTDISCYFKAACDNFNTGAFECIINKPQRYISKLNIEKLKNYKYRISFFDYLLYEGKLSNIQKIKVFNMKYKLSKVCSMHPYDAANYIFKNIGYNKYLDELISLCKADREDIALIKEEILNVLLKFKTLEEFIDHAAKAERVAMNGKRSGVNVSTIHGIKGMEYKNIIIMNSVDGIIPYSHKNIISDIEEERRLFYVAVTRTIDNLFVFIPEKLKGIAVKNSRFIDECSTMKKYLV